MKSFIQKLHRYISHYFIHSNQTYWQRIRTIVGPADKNDFDTIGQKNTRNAFEEFILDHSNKYTYLLDAGCNTGVEGYRLFKKGYKGHYTGIDSNEKAIAFAQKNLSEFPRTSFIVSDLVEIVFPGEIAHAKHRSFDIVLMKDVIEHHKHYKPVLTKLVQFAKKYFILSLFIHTSVSNKDNSTLHPDGYYLNTYSQKRLKQFFIKKGFKKHKRIFTDNQDEVWIFKR
ncbi:hypothetical protein COU88_00840 [Candidatus Roizmanbacteria bacterium CG10_big_fil_rev_8_21_14_0_10_39_6]|uniref:Methyltransferase domain-containing protein n=1 Tax=Candidatus Roizmanbacteria bacterium CG10_big_fil_rev_8_21_14_0_10_39_6 TaxID=1974853 RepID=A0A2M8KTE6_9BACT|nr:MAG: hypothetical protein COU88_00840 [Candidatus Roizmanbacteria bacterium CG10_big_fil_rev_8_21_14_0_10_39_6]